MWAVEYSIKYHNGRSCVPCADEQEARAMYDKIKAKIGAAPYNTRGELEGSSVEITTSTRGAITIDCRDLTAVWCTNTDDELMTKWNEHAMRLNAKRDKIYNEEFKKE